MTLLQDLLIGTAAAQPDAPALRCGDEEVTYAELDALSNRLAHALADLGVGAGDRVAVWLNKSIFTVAAMQAALRLGAAYVPVDPLSPAVRVATILTDCAVRAIVTDARRAASVRTGELADLPVLLSDADLVRHPATLPAPPARAENDLAYILYTSGSTGVPKGVCISHRNALAFIEWAAKEVGASPDDRFSSHAPFHFDLSVFDLYSSFSSGACTCIIPEDIAYVPGALTEFIRREHITVWYSVPSALVLMMDRGGLLDEGGLPLRVVIFAGEPFPIKHLRRLFDGLDGVRFFNWYGPTETNVCTSYEVTAIPEDWAVPVPIGQASCGDRVWAVRADGSEAGVGEEGELLCTGPTVFLGYWGREPHGAGPYRTGDLVRLLDDGNHLYVGRRDHMVKVRGHRVELGEVEAALFTHDAVDEAAVLVAGEGIEARLVAFVVCPGEPTPSLLQFKRHCAERVPRYMIVDEVRFLDELPRTRNGKVDRLRLQQVVAAGEGGT